MRGICRRFTLPSKTAVQGCRVREGPSLLRQTHFPYTY